MSFSEKHYSSLDGLELYYREYGGSDDKLPIICLSGLTRNSGDFHTLAERYCKTRKVYALDYRGRGKSQYDSDYKNYEPQTYVRDVFQFLMALKIEKAIFVGTSLGGLLSMGLAGIAPQYVAAILLNDIGPEVSQSGGERIAGYVGKDVRFASIEDAAMAQKNQFSGAYPDLDDEGWIKTAHVAFVFDADSNSYRPNYDLNLGKALQEQNAGGQPIDLWALFEGLKEIPTLAIRGAMSDVLSKESFKKMQDMHPKMQALTLENRGHVPLLDEPAALKIMDPFFDQL